MPNTIRKGLQTITWGDAQAEKFPSVFEHARAAGYEGVEIGYRRLEKSSPEKVKSMLNDAGLEPVATHIGGNIEDLDQARAEKEKVDEVVDTMKRIGIPYLHYSGIRYTGDAALKSAVTYLSELARRLKEEGIQLLYHNHAFEFEHEARVMNALLNDTSAKLGFCVDIGWLHKGGLDVVSFLEKHRERLGTIHYKDFASMETGLDTVPLGQGVVPLEAISAWINTNLPAGFWVLAEQDKPVDSIEDEVTANGHYLCRAFG